MNLSTDETSLMIEGDLAISAKYTSTENGPGVLALSCTEISTNDIKKTKLLLDPWSPEGFRIFHWVAGNAIVVCGAQCLVVIDLADLKTQATIPLEYEECEIRGQPWFTQGKNVLIIATESRVFCLDERLAFRWCWTVRAYSQNWWRLLSEPELQRDIIHINLRSSKEDVEIRLDVNNAVQILN